ncbi:MAG: hypothetical protein EBT20_14810 [Alphaproteobacteria bacterium]|nr:hypothetical protein [Alphaproteobacteria bacterium]
MRAETGLELPLRSVFSHASVTALAHLLDEAVETPPPYHPILPLKAGGKESPLFCIHPAGGISTVYRQLAMSLNWDCPVYGLQARGVENPEDPTFESIEEMALTYWSAIQTIQPSGPYQLLGWSFGGTVAIEIVSLIMAAGHAVDLLIMLDSPLVSVSADEDPNSDANMLELLADNIGFDLSEVPPEKRKNAVLLKMIELELAPDDANDGFIEGIITAVENSERLLEHHQPKAINCPVVYFKASDNMQQHIEKILANLGSTDVTVINANMRHAQMCSDINSQIIASALDTPLSPRQK